MTTIRNTSGGQFDEQGMPAEVEKPSLIKRVASSVGRGVTNFDRKIRKNVATKALKRRLHQGALNSKPNRFPKRPGAPLYDDEYGVLMNNENKRKLGINPKW